MSAVPPARRAGRPYIARGGGKVRIGRLAEPGRESESGVVSSSRKWVLQRDAKAEIPTLKKPIPEKTLKTTARKRKPWSMLGCIVCYLSPSLAGWGLRGGVNLTYPSPLFRLRQHRTYRRQLGPLYHCQPRPHSCCYPCLHRHHPFGCFPRHLHGCH